MLTPTQLATLKTDLAANTNTVLIGGVSTQIKDVQHTSDGAFAIAAWYNGIASPSFTVWKINATLTEVGDAINSTELAGLTSLNISRLQAIATYAPQGINPSLSDRRAAFDDIFSGAGGANTRAALLVLWKRLATRAEKLYATGTGSDAVPATLSFYGSLTSTDILNAWNS